MSLDESSGEQPQEKKMPEPSDSLDGNYQSDFEELLHAVVTPENAVKIQEAWAWILNVDIEFKSPSGIEFVLIPAGTFTRGSAEEEEEEEATPYQVSLTKPFYMGKFQITQAQWNAIMGNNSSHFKGDNRPVEKVSWDDCQKFIKKLNAREDVKNYRLPTEAEWEYACHAGTTTVFSFGDSLSSEQANFDGNYPYGGASKGKYLGRTTDVGSYEPNAWGLYDMHGNVWEWCHDWDGDYPTSPVTNPSGASSGSERVVRGGSWFDYARDCSAAFHDGIRPGVRNCYVGFRLLRSL